MCEFCTKHGEGKKWYLLMKNYSEELLHEGFSAELKEETQTANRAEWMDRFIEDFCMPAITAVPKPMQDVVRSLHSTTLLRAQEPTEEFSVEQRKPIHFGQVIPIEDAEQIIDMADSITRVPCGCRFISIGKADKRYCFGIGFDTKKLLGKYPDAASSLEVLEREEAKRIIRDYDEEGLIHTVWTGVTPFVVGLCNCDRDCLAYKTYIEQRGAPTFFRAEYVCRVDPELCDGCKECISQCQFGAQFYSSAEAKVFIDPTRCYGCAVCRPACPTDAIGLVPRKEEPQAAELWLKEA